MREQYGIVTTVVLRLARSQLNGSEELSFEATAIINECILWKVCGFPEGRPVCLFYVAVYEALGIFKRKEKYNENYPKTICIDSDIYHVHEPCSMWRQHRHGSRHSVCR